MISHFSLRVICAVTALAGFFQGAPVLGQITFMGLGPSALGARDVSGDGSVVVGDGFRTNGPEHVSAAYRWTSATGAVNLGDLPGVFSSVASAVSSDGSVVVGSWSYPIGPASLPGQAYRWTSADGKVPLGHLQGGSWTVARGVSGDGEVVVGFGDTATGVAAYRWTEASGLETIGATWANNISRDGSTIVGTTILSAEERQAYRWTQDGGVETLGVLEPGHISAGLGVSADGAFVVGADFDEDISQQAFLWSESTGMIDLGMVRDASESAAWAVSGDGSVVIGIYDLTDAFIWTPESGMRVLIDVLTREYGLAEELEGWRLTAALGISADGRYLVGNGLHNGEGEAWLLDRGVNPPPILPPPIIPVPEPGTYGLMAGVGLMGAIAWRRRRGVAIRSFFGVGRTTDRIRARRVVDVDRSCREPRCSITEQRSRGGGACRGGTLREHGDGL
jgi:probable HAF family extracellular repeat protein